MCLDSSLTWSDHVFKYIKKFNSKLELIRRPKPYLSPNHTLLLYNSIAKPTIEYCCSVSGNCSSELLQQVLLAQKRAERLLLNADISCRSLELFQKLRICPFSDIVRQCILNLTFESLNDLFPDSMANLFKRRSPRYATRAKTNLILTLPKAKTNAGKRRFSYMAPTIWNSIPGHLHLITFFNSDWKLSSSLYYTHIKTKQQTCSIYKFSILKNIYVSNYLRLSKFLLIKILLKRSVLILAIMKE